MPTPCTARDVIVEPFFFDTEGGRLFGVHHSPAHSAVIKGQVLVVPPFNEEMNRCRSMVTLQAQAFATLGFGTLLVDLFGTGDSEGEHGQARWTVWLANLRSAYLWLQTKPGSCRALLGIRLGCILAAEMHNELALRGVPLVLWQPVLDGKIHLTQFLRVRMAASLDRVDVPKETTATMRKQFATGEPVEVAGYEVHPELAAAIDAARLADFVPAPPASSLWLELAAADMPGISAPTQAVASVWQASGISPHLQNYTGPAFWQVHERVVTPSLIDATTAWLGAQSAAT